MTIPRSSTIKVPSPSGWKNLAYWEWGHSDNPEVVICVHGLTRNARDFDALAESLSRDFRVIAPDVMGRGKSNWLDTAEEYTYTRYVQDAVALIARAGVERVHWVGTSMGGILGMMLDASPHAPFKSMVINDVGALIPGAALRDLADYVGKDPSFQSLAEAADYFARVHAPFGSLPRSYWEQMAMTSVRWEDPVYRLHYDPKIGAVFNKPIFDIDLSGIWASGRTPSLLIRGTESTLFPEAVAARMMEVRPSTEMVRFEGCGHAQSLAVPEQMELVRDYLLRHRG